MSWGYKKKIEQDFDQQKYFDLLQSTNKNYKPNQIQQQEQEDALDAYMNNLNQQVQKQKKQEKRIQKVQKIFQEDPVDEYFIDMKKKILKQQKITKKMNQKQAGYSNEQQQQVKFNPSSQQQANCQFLDSDGQVDLQAIKKSKKKKIQVLQPIDFTEIKLQPFQKNFYNEHAEISHLDQSKVKEIRAEWGMKVKGKNVPKPIISFAHLGFNQTLIDLIIKQNYQKPTPIQSQALPICLSGRDIVGIAKTGSGKTLAYVWPMIIHILDQREIQKNEGPIGLILAPTRELCQQIFIETKKFAKKFNLKVGCVLGGENKHQQWKILKAGVDILIASPGRLIQMIKKKATNLLRTTYLVLDEADKMFSLGFQPQIRSIVGQIRQDRQTLLFSATLKKTIQSLVVDILTDPITINIGEQNQANDDIKQEIVVLNNVEEKMVWLQKNINSFIEKGKVLIFVNQINNCNILWDFFLSKLSLNALVLHGDKTQYQRTNIINSFKLNNQLLVATDIASRGLDVREIKTVINYDPPKDCDTYIHRIGRTGRAGDKDGTAYSLLLDTQTKFAINLIRILETTGSPVPYNLQQVALKDDKFKVKRMSVKMGVSFAKGKDATKLLNQALKRQRNSNVKSGLGYTQPDLIKKSKRQLNMSDIIQKNRSALQVQSQQKPLKINQLHLLLTHENLQRNKPYQLKQGAKTLFNNKFVKAQHTQATKQIKQITVTLGKKNIVQVQKPLPVSNKNSKWDK